MSKLNTSVITGVILFIARAHAMSDLTATVEYAGTMKSVAPMSIKVKGASGERDCKLPCQVKVDDALTNTLPESLLVKIPVKNGADAEVLVDIKSSIKFEKGETGIVPVLDLGVTHVNVPPTKDKNAGFRFFIRTQTATMGVRGTEFVLEQSDSGETKLNTLEGTVGMGKNASEFVEEKGKSAKWSKVEAGMMGSWSHGESHPKEIREFNRDAFKKQWADKHPQMAKAVERRMERRQESKRDHKEERKDRRQDYRNSGAAEGKREMRREETGSGAGQHTQKDFDKLLRGTRSGNPTALPQNGVKRR